MQNNVPTARLVQSSIFGGLASIAVIAAMALTGPAHAAMLTNNSAWASDPIVETWSPYAIPAGTTTATARLEDVHTTNFYRQSFRTDTTFTVDTVHLGLTRNYAGDPFKLEFWSIPNIADAGTGGATPTGGTLIKSIDVPLVTGFNNAGPFAVQVDLDASEEFQLTANTAGGTDGYLLRLLAIDVAGNAANTWILLWTYNNSDVYTDGYHGRYWNNDSLAFRDFSLALSGSVPEPGSIALLMIGGLLMARRWGRIARGDV